LKNFLDEILNSRSAGPLSAPVSVAGTGTETKKLDFTGTQRKILAGPEPGPEKKYQDRDRDQIKRVTGTWTGTKKSWSRTCLIFTHAQRVIFSLSFKIYLRKKNVTIKENK
jgi:hypothetical protein